LTVVDHAARGQKLGQETLEDLVEHLNKQLQQNPDWLKTHTAEKWLKDNPEAAASLQEMFPDKKLTPLRTPHNSLVHVDSSVDKERSNSVAPVASSAAQASPEKKS
jgi:hypothetical protein